MTVDVECFSFETNSYDYEGIPNRIHKEALPRLLDLFDKYNVKATFFFTGRFAELSPESVELVFSRGHEIGCHGYSHESFFDEMGFDEQAENLVKSKTIIEQITGKTIVSFRAPALRVNADTVKALEKAGFKYDSSVASQRFDALLTTGARRKLAWFFANRRPYRMSYDGPFRAGESKVVEVPVSALLWPFVGTHMRVSPFLTGFIQRMLMLESRFTGKPLVFLFHPNEALDFIRRQTVERGNWFTDNLRHRVKMRNLGGKSMELLEKVFSRGDYDFKTVSGVRA